MLGQQPEASIHLMINAQTPVSAKAEFQFIAAIVHTQFGDRAGTLVCLRRALELQFSSAEIWAAPEFKQLHGDPEFKAVVGDIAKSGRGDVPLACVDGFFVGRRLLFRLALHPPVP